MKTRRILILLVPLLFSGCLKSTLKLPPDIDKIEKIEAGTLESSVRIIAGPPDRIIPSKNGYRTYYYREKMTSDCQKDLKTCIPIVIERGKVAAVGSQWVKAWERQQPEKASPGPGKSAQTAETGPETVQQKIARLDKQVRSIPMSRTMDNLNIYRYLHTLSPDNERYKQKLAFYEKRFEKEKAQRVARKKQLAALRRWQNARLHKLQGNPPVQMAIKILEGGKFYVWLKNTGKAPFKVEPRHFFLSCVKGKRYTIYRSKDFGKELQPGEIIEGRVTFATSCDPEEFIYANPGVATVSRKIPVPETKRGTPSPAALPHTHPKQ